MRYTTLIILTVFTFISKVTAQEIILEPDSALKKKVIKFEFFSPLTGNTTFGYEQYLKNFTSIEAKIGIIGLGKQNLFSASGVFLKVGPKFKLKPSYATKGTFGTHLLRGTYIRPEIAVSFFKWQDEDFFTLLNRPKEINVKSVALLINYGKQFVLGKIMTLDWHFGIGYGFSNHEDQGYYFGYSAGNSNTPIAFSTGFTLGFLLD
jgi:hypothetical protein